MRLSAFITFVFFSMLCAASVHAQSSQQFLLESAGYIPYQITSNVLAQNCEFYINSFGDAYNNKANERWLEAQITLGTARSMARGYSIANAGGFIEYIIDSNNTTMDNLQIAVKQGGNAYFMKIPYNDYNASSPDYRKISVFNFFIDVKTDSGAYYRYWITSNPYTFQGIFWGYPYSVVERGESSGITYTQPPSPILERRKTCTSQ